MIARFLIIQLLVLSSIAGATPWNLPHALSDENLQASFSVSAPWHLLKGSAVEIKGSASLATPTDPGSIRADLDVQSLDYSASLRPAANVLRIWLKNNPLTPANFKILKTNLECDPAALSDEGSCKGTIDGRAVMKTGTYNVDVPIVMTRQGRDFLLEGEKEIEWGQYGIGHEDHPIAYLKPSITFTFSALLNAPEQKG